MPLVNLFSRLKTPAIALCCIQLFSLSANAEHLEITSLIGYTFSPKLTSYDRTTEIATTNEPNIALAFSWQDSKAGQGQILVNYISRDFTNDVDQSTHSFDTIYTHFNGVAFFRDKNYITTVSMGLGATYFDSDFDSAIYPSITIGLGTRYEFSDNLAFITEIRAYATLTKDDDTVFCQNDSCVAHFDDAIWIDSQISMGFAYRF